MAEEGNNLLLQNIDPSEVYQGTNAVYYLEITGSDAEGYQWVSVTNPSISRDRWFIKSQASCYEKGNPNPVACKINPNWKNQNILIVTKDKKSYLLPKWGATPQELTETNRKKNGITPLGSSGDSAKGELDKGGYGGKGSGGAAPWGLNLPLFNVDVWGNIPAFLLWIGAANGVIQAEKKFVRKEKIGVTGWAGIVGGIYCGNELIRRKRKSDAEKNKKNE